MQILQPCAKVSKREPSSWSLPKKEKILTLLPFVFTVVAMLGITLAMHFTHTCSLSLLKAALITTPLLMAAPLGIVIRIIAKEVLRRRRNFDLVDPNASKILWAQIHNYSGYRAYKFLGAVGVCAVVAVFVITVMALPKGLHRHIGWEKAIPLQRAYAYFWVPAFIAAGGMGIASLLPLKLGGVVGCSHSSDGISLNGSVQNETHHPNGDAVELLYPSDM